MRRALPQLSVFPSACSCMSLLSPAPCRASLLPRARAARRVQPCARRCAPVRAPRRFGAVVAAAASSADVVDVGAGVAGLLCARTLQQARDPPDARFPAPRLTASLRRPGWTRCFSRRRMASAAACAPMRWRCVSGGALPRRLRWPARNARLAAVGRVLTPCAAAARFAQGFLLDRGFQIFLTSYPEARACLDYEALKLQPFYAGALVRFAGGWHRVADPARHPVDALASLLPDNAVGDVADKLRVGLLRGARGLDARARAASRSRRRLPPRGAAC